MFQMPYIIVLLRVESQSPHLRHLEADLPDTEAHLAAAKRFSEAVAGA